MSKKIKISIKNNEKLEFTLDENASAGDYICINDINEIDLDETRKFFSKLVSEEEAKLKQEIIAKEKQNIINEFKTGNEYQQMQKDLVEANKKYSELKSQQDSQLQLKALEVEKKFTTEINTLKNSLQQQELIAKNKLQEKETEWKNKEDKLNEEIEVLKRQRYTHSTKTIGENFEDYIANEINEQFGAFDYILNEKATKEIEGKKPDFLFNVFDDTKTLKQTIVIEAKTESLTGKTKNRDHFSKLDGDRKRNNGTYAILVTELEPDVIFSIQRVKEYENMYMVRPEYLLVILNILTVICRKEIMLQKQFENQQINFEEKQKIIDQFEELKTGVESQLEHIEKKASDILKQAETIDSSSKKIKDAATAIIETNKKTIVNKINNFNIIAKVKRIDKLNHEESSDTTYEDEETLMIKRKLA